MHFLRKKNNKRKFYSINTLLDSREQWVIPSSASTHCLGYTYTVALHYKFRYIGISINQSKPYPLMLGFGLYLLHDIKHALNIENHFINILK